MCGIAGWLDFENLGPDRPMLEAMTRTLRHRGPDGEGFYESGPVHLGHRRLSIIDLVGSAQPLCNEDASIWIIFNGEIFNFQELRKNLIAKGHQFKTTGDTETLVHAYEEYGQDMVDHLRGQFAFAIWDGHQEQLFLARDRMGQMPLYFARLPGGIVFGSELKAVKKHVQVRQELDLLSLDAYLAFRYVPEPRSIYQHVEKLPPAHRMLVSRRGIAVTRYWAPNFEDKVQLSEQETLEQLDELLRESVRLRMIADVPLGAFLSGGIDSTLVVAAMSREASSPVKTFTIGFEEESHDEREHAQFVASKFGTEHHPFVVRPNAVDVLPTMVEAFDEPFADSSALAVYYLSQLTRQHVTVALNGDGGDESFAGYTRYKSTLQFEQFRRIPSLVRDAGVGLVRGLGRSPLGLAAPVRQAARWAEYAQLGLAEFYERASRIDAEVRRSILSPALRQAVDALETWHPIATAFDGLPLETIDRILLADQQVYLPGDLLVKVDRMAMHHSLECRSPFLDHHIVDFAARLPATRKIPSGRLKHLLKQLLLRDFPKDFVERKKHGFGVPVAHWFRTQLRDWTVELLSQSKLVQDGICERLAVDRLLRYHAEGRTRFQAQLWSLVNLELWYARVHLAGA